jgi:hypothetical protein
MTEPPRLFTEHDLASRMLTRQAIVAGSSAGWPTPEERTFAHLIYVKAK